MTFNKVMKSDAGTSTGTGAGLTRVDGYDGNPRVRGSMCFFYEVILLMHKKKCVFR
jgi:hypothetical protein